MGRMGTEGDDFEVLELAAVDGEADERAFLVPALNAGSTRVDVQQPEGLIVFYFQDMRMSGDEELRRIGEKRRADGEVVVTGIAADMLDEHIDILALEAVQFAVHQAEVTAVAVAANGAEGAESR